jgi:hypothetical protein
VHLVTTTVVRLVGALAHESLFRIAMGGSGDRRRSARAGQHDSAADRPTVRGGRRQGQTVGRVPTTCGEVVVPTGGRG